MSTENIQKFLRPPDKGGAYTDEKLAALLAHAEDGKLSHCSCCCLAGIPSATHSLRSIREFDYDEQHRSQAFTDISMAFGSLGHVDGEALSKEESDAVRRARLIPLIHAEMALREKERALAEANFLDRQKLGVPRDTDAEIELY